MRYGTTAALGYLRDGLCVEVVGRPGSGRTHVVRRIDAYYLDRGARTVQVGGTVGAAASGQPGLAVTVHDGGKRPPVTTTVESVSQLRREAVGAAALLVDDADELDEAGARLLAAFSAHRDVPLLVTRRTGRRPGAAFRALAGAMQPAVRLTVPPLRLGDLREVVGRVLDGPVDVEAIARIATASGGLPGLARTVALVGRRSGALRWCDGRWTDTGPLWSPPLAHAVQAQLADAGDEDVEALTLLASAGSVSVVTARSLLPAPTIERLNDLGLLELIDGPDGGTVGIYPPLLGEYLVREGMTSSRRMSVRDTLVDHGVELRPGLVSRRHPSMPLDDAILSNAVAEHWSGIVHARLTAWRAEPVPRTAVALLRGHLASSQGGVDPAAVYAGTDRTTGSVLDRMELEALHALYLGLVRHDREAAADVLRRADEQLPTGAPYFRSVADHLDFVLEGLPVTPDPGARPGGSADLAGEVAEVLDIEALIAQGRTREAVHSIDQAAPSQPAMRGFVAEAHGLALLLSGRIDEGMRLARAGIDEASGRREPGTIQAHAYVLALGLALQGRLSELEQHLSSTLTITSVAVLQAHLRSGLVGLASACDRWQGRRDLTERVRGLPARPVGPFPYTTSRPRPGDADLDPWDSVDAAVRSGYLASAAFLALDAAEIDPDCLRAAEVAPVLAQVDGPLLSAVVDLSGAIGRRDLDGLRSAGAVLDRCGATLLVVRAMVAEALVLREQGRTADAAAVATRAWDRATAQMTGWGGLFAPLLASIDLTRREGEIAEYVVDGASTAEIASLLVLSPRTIENHLLNTYRKIGVDSREDLRRVSTTWLHSAMPSAQASEPVLWSPGGRDGDAPERAAVEARGLAGSASA